MNKLKYKSHDQFNRATYSFMTDKQMEAFIKDLIKINKKRLK